MECERHSKAQFDQEFGGKWQSTESSSNRGGFKVPSDDGRNEVSSSENVEAAWGDWAGDTMKSTSVPGDLRAIDGEMGRNWTLETLFGEDLGWVGCACCCWRCWGWSAYMLAEMTSVYDVPPWKVARNSEWGNELTESWNTSFADIYQSQWQREKRIWSSTDRRSRGTGRPLLSARS